MKSTFLKFVTVIFVSAFTVACASKHHCKDCGTHEGSGETCKHCGQKVKDCTCKH